MLRRSMSRVTIIATVWRYYSRRKVYNVSTVNYHTTLDKYWQSNIFLEILNKSKRCVKKRTLIILYEKRSENLFKDPLEVSTPPKSTYRNASNGKRKPGLLLHDASFRNNTAWTHHICRAWRWRDETVTMTIQSLRWHFSKASLACDATHWESYMV